MLSREFPRSTAEIKKILWNERMKAEAKRDAEKDERVVFCITQSSGNRQGAQPGTFCLL